MPDTFYIIDVYYIIYLSKLPCEIDVILIPIYQCH